MVKNIQRTIVILLITVITIIVALGYIKTNPMPKIITDTNQIQPQYSYDFIYKLIAGLLTVITFFIAYYFNQQTQAYNNLKLEITNSHNTIREEFTKSNKELNDTLKDLNITLAGLKQWKEDNEKLYDEHKRFCNERFNEINKNIKKR